MNIKLTAAQKIKIINSNDVYGIMQKVLLRENKLSRNKEHFWIVCMDAKNKILLIELIGLGTLTATIIEPVDVFSFALQKQAVKMIMVHNHPSGDTKASKADIALTDRMAAVGRFLHLPVVDHLIIAEKTYFSFADTGLLKEIEDKSHFDLTFSKLDKYKDEIEEKQQEIEQGKRMAKKAVEKAKVEAEKVAKIDMAKKMLGKKKSIAEIVEFTGLTKKQVEGLKR